MKRMRRFIGKNKSIVSKVILGIMLFSIIISAIPLGVLADNIDNSITTNVEEEENIIEEKGEDVTKEEENVIEEEEIDKEIDKEIDEEKEGNLIINILEYDNEPSKELIAIDKEIYLSGAGFQVSNNNLVNSAISDSNGKAILTVPYGEYTIKQSTAPDKYKMNNVTEIIINVNKEETNVYFYNALIKEEIKKEKIDIKVTKDWEGTEEESIKVNLLANGEIIDTVNIVNNDWTFTFKDLDILDEDNNIIKYTVEEVRNDGQVIKVYGNVLDGFIITSTIIVPDVNKIDIDVKKVWEGKKQARAVINLMIGHEKIDSIVLNSKNNWQYTFENLNYNDENDLKINYSVTEDEIEGYEVEITGNSEKGFVITNIENKPVYTEKRDIYVKKVWDGEKQKRTEVDLILNNKVIDSVILNESNRWQHTFEDLDATDEEGVELEYTIGEEKIRGYSVKVTGNMNRGFTITNTEEGRESKRDISIEKYWIGEPLDEVTIKLFANGKEIEKVKLNNRNKFKYVFEDMPVFKYVKAKDRNGVSYEIEEEIEYTIGELKIDGYKVDIKGDMKKGFEITNTQIEEPNPIKIINIPVNMSWIGSSPAKNEIAIKLFGDTNIVDSVILSDFNNWSHVFRDMPAVNSETDKDIIYYLSDVIVEGYNVNIEGSMSTGYTIVATPNHYRPDVLSYDYVHHNANDTGGDIVIDDNNIDSRPSLEKNNDYVEDVKTNDPGIIHTIILSILTGALFIIINKKRKLNKFK